MEEADSNAQASARGLLSPQLRNARLVSQSVHSELFPNVRREEAGSGAKPGNAAAEAACADLREWRARVTALAKRGA